MMNTRANYSDKDLAEAHHLLGRAGFGAQPGEAEALAPLSRKERVERLMQASSTHQDVLGIPAPQYGDPMERIKKIEETTRGQLAMGNHAWLHHMAHAQAQLREKLTLFWHGHFACRLAFVFLTQTQVNMLRKHALGSYKDILFGISKDPGMLLFLNNQQNRKAKPNENFAREVMELFTLGRGNYTEQDVKEAARAFTGWAVGLDGQFLFRERQHDAGEKTFRGKSGNFGGEDILNMLLEDRATAQRMAGKFYTFYVSDQAPEPGLLNDLARRYYESGYDTAALLRHIFTADWFYQAQGKRIKSPMELMAGQMRFFSAQVGMHPILFRVGSQLGQIMYFPPNVGGWPHGRGWIDTSSMAFRQRLGPFFYGEAQQATLAYAPIVRQGKALTDEMYDPNLMGADPTQADPLKMVEEMRRTGKNMPLEVKADLARVDQAYGSLKEPQDLVEALAQTLLRVPLSPHTRPTLLGVARETPAENRVRYTALALMSLPEYQLI